jgi:hypothetical protein
VGHHRAGRAPPAVVMAKPAALPAALSQVAALSDEEAALALRAGRSRRPS